MEEILLYNFWARHVESPDKGTLDPRIAGRQVNSKRDGKTGMSRPLAPRAQRKSRGLTKAEIQADPRLKELFEDADQKEFDAFFKLGTIRVATEE